MFLIEISSNFNVSQGNKNDVELEMRQLKAQVKLLNEKVASLTKTIETEGHRRQENNNRQDDIIAKLVSDVTKQSEEMRRGASVRSKPVTFE